MKKVLIVDDYEDILDILSFVLQDEQIKVKCLINAAQLNEHLAVWQPDLVMLDVSLGSADGRSLCNEIKSNAASKHIKVVLMSALPEGWQNFPCKADAKIDKPFDIDEVRNIILGLLNLKSLEVRV